MTLLADHASPYLAHSLPKRSELKWQGEGLHVLLSDACGAATLEKLIAQPCNMDYVNFGIIRLDEAEQRLMRLRPKHLLAIGTEPFLQKIDALAWRLRLPNLQTQRVGEDKRDVLCMNCRKILKSVRFRIQPCDCGFSLLVRDHYSARLGLYQGAALPPDDPLIQSLSDQKLSP